MVYFTLKIVRFCLRILLLPLRIVRRLLSARSGSESATPTPVPDDGTSTPVREPDDEPGDRGEPIAADRDAVGSTERRRSWFAIVVGILGALSLVGGLGEGNVGGFAFGALLVGAAVAIHRGNPLAWKLTMGWFGLQFLFTTGAVIFAFVAEGAPFVEFVIALAVLAAIHLAILFVGYRERQRYGVEFGDTATLRPGSSSRATRPSAGTWTERLVISLVAVACLWLLRAIDHPLVEAEAHRFVNPVHGDPTWLYFSIGGEAAWLTPVVVVVPLAVVALLTRRPTAARILAGGYFGWIVAGYLWFVTRPHADVLEVLTIPTDSATVHALAYLYWMEFLAVVAAGVGLIAAVQSRDDDAFEADVEVALPTAGLAVGLVVAGLVLVLVTVDTGSVAAGVVAGGLLGAGAVIVVGRFGASRSATETSETPETPEKQPIEPSSTARSAVTSNPAEASTETAAEASTETAAEASSAAEQPPASPTTDQPPEAEMSAAKAAVGDSSAETGQSDSSAVTEVPTQRWRHELEVHSLITCDDDSRVLAVEREGGSIVALGDSGVRWRYSLGGEVAGAAITPATVLVAGANGTVTALEADGEERWSLPYRTGERVAADPAAGDHGYVLDETGRIHALDLDSGGVAWTFDVPRATGVAAGRAALLTTDDAVVAVADGDEQWRTRCSTPTTRPVPDGDGAVVGTASGVARVDADGVTWQVETEPVEAIDVAAAGWHVRTTQAVYAIDEGSSRWRAEMDVSAGPARYDGAAVVATPSSVVCLDDDEAMDLLDVGGVELRSIDGGIVVRTADDAVIRFD